MKRLSLAMVALLAVAACRILESDDSRFVYNGVTLTRIEAPDTVKAGSEVPVVIEGLFPTPAWEIDRVTIQELGRRVILRPIGRLDRQKEPVIQIVVSFSDTVRVSLELPGTYTIEVIGLNEILTEKVVAEADP